MPLNRNGDRTFNLSFVVSADLTVDELWPGGDAPDDPTEKDVEGLIEAAGGWSKVLDDWNLIEPHDRGNVTDNQRYADEVRAMRGCWEEEKK